jgi:phenylpropionate dioxygenase-like ring-hydroxylating dioxygenase large terminal subunit
LLSIPSRLSEARVVTQHPTLRKFWYATVPLSHLDDGPKPFTLFGEQIVAWKGADGTPAALKDRCCHSTAKLSRGWADGNTIVCGYHGWTYDHGGKCVRIPQQPDTATPAGARVPAYRCEAKYGCAWVALEEPLRPIPDFGEDAEQAMWR